MQWKVDELRDAYQPLAEFIVALADRIAYAHGMRCRIAQAYRSAAEQDQKFAQGYSKVQGGYSWHQYHLAFDVGLFNGEDFDEYINGSHARYRAALAVYDEIGRAVTEDPRLATVFWGGRFPEVFGGDFIDRPHYEFHPEWSVRGGAAQVIAWKARPLEVPLDLRRYPPLPLVDPAIPMQPESFDPTPEQEAAYDLMRNIGVYTDDTPRNASVTTEMVSVYMQRLVELIKEKGLDIT